MSEQKDNQTGMPEWLHKLLEAKTGGFRAARWQRCPNCAEITLHGMDADRCAGMVTVDPTPITRQQEMWCAIQGRPTYSLDIDADRKIKINDRNKWALAKPTNKPVVPAHHCGQRYSGFVTELRKTTTTAAAAPPPF